MNKIFHFALLEMPDGDMVLPITQSEVSNLLLSILAGYNFYLHGKEYVVRPIIEYFEENVSIAQFMAELFRQNNIAQDNYWEGYYQQGRKSIDMKHSQLTCRVTVGAQLNKHFTMLEIDDNKQPVGQPKMYRLLFWEQRPQTIASATPTTTSKPLASTSSGQNTAVITSTASSSASQENVYKKYWDMFKNCEVGEANDQLSQMGYGGLIAHFNIPLKDYRKKLHETVQITRFAQWIKSFPSQQNF